MKMPTHDEALALVREARLKHSQHKREADYWDAELRRRLRILRRAAKRHPEQYRQFVNKWIFERWDSLLKRLAD